MIDLKEYLDKDISILNNQIAKISEFVDIIRIATLPDNIVKVVQYVDVIKSHNIACAVNLMYIHQYIDNNVLIKKLSVLNNNVDFLYLVDSYGSLFPDQVSSLIHLIQEQVKNVELGFHAHDNIELSFANSLQALKHNIKYVDSTMLGIGRGAGNLKTELILQYYETKDEKKYLYENLYELINKFAQLKQSCSWGSNLAYSMSGFHKIAQSKVYDLISKNRSSIEEIINIVNENINIINNIATSDLSKFDIQNKEKVFFIGGCLDLDQIEYINNYFSKNPDASIFHITTKYINHFLNLQISNL